MSVTGQRKPTNDQIALFTIFGSRPKIACRITVTPYIAKTK